MGRQIGFYMMPKDEEEFFKMIKEWRIEIYPSTIKNLPPKPIDTKGFFFYNPKAGGELKYDYNKKQHYYDIDSMVSYVIEFSGSGTSEYLHEGRLWAEISYWDKDQKGNHIIIKKSQEFIKFFNNLTNWIRRNYEKYGSSYISPRVIQHLKKRGGNNAKLKKSF